MNPWEQLERDLELSLHPAFADRLLDEVTASDSVLGAYGVLADLAKALTQAPTDAELARERETVARMADTVRRSARARDESAAVAPNPWESLEHDLEVVHPAFAERLLTDVLTSENTLGAYGMVADIARVLAQPATQAELTREHDTVARMRRIVRGTVRRAPAGKTYGRKSLALVAATAAMSTSVAWASGVPPALQQASAKALGRIGAVIADVRGTDAAPTAAGPLGPAASHESVRERAADVPEPRPLPATSSRQPSLGEEGLDSPAPPSNEGSIAGSDPESGGSTEEPSSQAADVPIVSPPASPPAQQPAPPKPDAQPKPDGKGNEKPGGKDKDKPDAGEQPVDELEPEDPSEGGKPEDPGKPGEPGKPDDKGKPEDPGQPGEPGKPDDKGKPEDPGKPEEPGPPETVPAEPPAEPGPPEDAGPKEKDKETKGE